MHLLVILLILLIISSRKTLKKQSKPLPSSAKSDIPGNKDSLSLAEKTSLYFDTRMESLIKRTYGQDISHWEYTSSLPILHYRNKENEVIIYFRNGTVKKEIFFTANVWGTRPVKEEQVIPPEPELSDAQKWMIKHAGVIDEIIFNNLKNGQVETDFLHEVDNAVLLGEIVTLIAENTPYTAVLNGKFIKINAQALMPEQEEL